MRSKAAIFIGAGLLALFAIMIASKPREFSPTESPLAEKRAEADKPTPPLFQNKLKPVPELVIRNQIENEVRDLLLPVNPEKYDSFERVLAPYRSDSARTSSGIRKLSVFYRTLDSKLLSYTIPDGVLVSQAKHLDRWVKQMPESPSAVVYNGIALLNYAKAAIFLRSTVETMTPERLAEFNSRLAQAEKFMRDHRATGSIDPHFYKVLIDIAALKNTPFGEIQTVLNEASERHPYYYEIYFAAIDAAIAKSSEMELGERIAHIVEQGVAKTSSKDGTGFYARGYWSASALLGVPVHAIPMVDWEKMRAGMNDVYARYAEAWNANNFALFACLASDGSTTRTFLTPALATPVESVWRSAENMQRCVAFSNSTASTLQ